MLFDSKFVAGFTACTIIDSTELASSSTLMSMAIESGPVQGTRQRQLNALRVLHYSASLIQATRSEMATLITTCLVHFTFS